MTSAMARTEFDKLVSRISGKEKEDFLDWLRNEYLASVVDGPRWDDSTVLARMELRKISDELRSAVPFEAVLDSEKLYEPVVGEDVGLTRKNTVHLDSFLYDNADEERMLGDGTIPRSICKDCGSLNCEDVTIITHSCSHEKIEWIFRGLLPPLKDKTVLDVGSRLGAVLFGGFHHSKASRLVGVEISAEFCDIANKAVKKHCLDKRIEIINDDVANVPNVVKAANVIILNNVFEWFQEKEKQVKLWQYLKETITPGSLIVTVPSLETSLEHLSTGIELDEWVDECEPCNPDFSTDNEMDSIFLYRVK